MYEIVFGFILFSLIIMILSKFGLLREGVVDMFDVF